MLRTSEQPVLWEDKLVSLRVGLVRGWEAGWAGRNTGLWLAAGDPSLLFLVFLL